MCVQTPCRVEITVARLLPGVVGKAARRLPLHATQYLAGHLIEDSVRASANVDSNMAPIGKMMTTHFEYT